jgi:DNA invertase Pin-like site-specific DNA recombinase
MKIGYARTSTVEQQASIEAQADALRAIGCEKVFVEQVSAVAKRPQLDAAIEFARQGDEFVVMKLDRLARSVADLLSIEARLAAKGVTLRVEGSPIETATPTGRLMLQVLGSVAEFERALMLERQKVGVAKAKAEGRYKGRAPTARAKENMMRNLENSGVGRTEIARQCGVSVASVYRVLGPPKHAITE